MEDRAAIVIKKLEVTAQIVNDDKFLKQLNTPRGLEETGKVFASLYKAISEAVAESDPEPDMSRARSRYY